MPTEPVKFQEDQQQLTHEFLVRQSSVVSAEKASSLVTHYTCAVQDAAGQYIATASELANLYEASVSASLTEEGDLRVGQLRLKCSELKQTLADLEMLSHFVKKLGDANAEVCFLAGAEFASVQASERLLSAMRTVTELFEKARLLELDLVMAQQKHIEAASRTLDDNHQGDTKESRDQE